MDDELAVARSLRLRLLDEQYKLMNGKQFGAEVLLNIRDVEVLLHGIRMILEEVNE